MRHGVGYWAELSDITRRRGGRTLTSRSSQGYWLGPQLELELLALAGVNELLVGDRRYGPFVKTGRFALHLAL